MRLSTSSTGRALLLAPTIALLCADSPGTGCGGHPDASVRRGSLTCSITLDGAGLPCAGEWSYSAGSRTYTVIATAGRGSEVPAVMYTAPVSLMDSRAGADMGLGTGLAGWARVVTPGGGYEAALGFGGSRGTLRLVRLDPPRGTFAGVLVPSTLAGTETPGLAGTAVALEIVFEALAAGRGPGAGRDRSPP